MVALGICIDLLNLLEAPSSPLPIAIAIAIAQYFTDISDQPSSHHAIAHALARPTVGVS
jgi:hypothetical protein